MDAAALAALGVAVRLENTAEYYTGFLGELPGLEACRRSATSASSGGLLGHIFAGFLGPARLGQGAAAAHGEVAESFPDQVDCRVQGGGAARRGSRLTGGCKEVHLVRRVQVVDPHA